MHWRPRAAVPHALLGAPCTVRGPALLLWVFVRGSLCSVARLQARNLEVLLFTGMLVSIRLVVAVIGEGIPASGRSS
jgi:hypothetical protein